MKVSRLYVNSILAVVVVSVLWIASDSAMAQERESGGTVIVEGLNGPQGVLVIDDGSVWVIDVGLGGDEEVEVGGLDPNTNEIIRATYGNTSRVMRVIPGGQPQLVATLPSIFLGSDIVGGARLALLNNEMYATAGVWQGVASEEALPDTAAVLRVLQGSVLEVVPLWKLEKELNPDGHVLESHPYGLTAGPDGLLYVAEAGANTLVQVDVVSQTAKVIAVFDGIPGPLPNPYRGGALESDPVPTGVTFGADGRIYVSLLPGFPFLPGSAKIVVVDPVTGGVEDYATDLTMLTDLRTGPDGELYAVRFGIFTDEGPIPNSGAVIRVGEGETSQDVVTGLPFPTSVDFDINGNAFVTINGASVGEPGRGKVIRFEGVAVQGAPSIRFVESATVSQQEPEFVTGCDSLPSHEAVKAALERVVASGNNGGLGNHMWATVVDRDGMVCAIAFSGANRGSQWPGGRVLSVQKANSANAFSLTQLSFSTSNLYAATQPGGNLYGLQGSTPLDTAKAYAGPASDYGQAGDPLVGERAGGWSRSGGGLSLYSASGSLVGAIGISGDTPCADHIVAWKVRDALQLDFIPAGVSPSADDNIIFDLQANGTSLSGFGHPRCGFDEERFTEKLPADFPIGTVGEVGR
ncbi:MAG: ScyD/ScyE family protein [Caldilineaceae bacterium SB0662_bin_25]|nr:ScyD/ScyE family protein [Caldilineaceae bacterium SB0662_bin_25]